MRTSIISNEKQCYVCGDRRNLHRHHVIFGKSRKKADEDGLTVWLCYNHHEGTYGVHGKLGHSLDMQLKCTAERCWIETYKKTTDEFRKRYGRNYL